MSLVRQKKWLVDILSQKEQSEAVSERFRRADMTVNEREETLVLTNDQISAASPDPCKLVWSS